MDLRTYFGNFFFITDPSCSSKQLKTNGISIFIKMELSTFIKLSASPTSNEKVEAALKMRHIAPK